MEKKSEDISAFSKHLVSEKLLSLKEAKAYEARAIKKKTGMIDILEESELLDSGVIANHVAHFFKHPFFDLDRFDEARIPVKFRRASFVKNHAILPLIEENNILFIALSDPTSPILSNIKALTGMKTSLIIVEHSKLEMMIDSLLSRDSELSMNLGNVEMDELDLDDQISASGGGSAVVRYINSVLMRATKNRSSDIHFEPFETSFRIRSREDGILKTLASPAVDMSNNLISRLKIMANLDIAESRVPQDGRTTLKLTENYEVEFRVSTCPTTWGEKIVMRVMTPPENLFTPEKLGMNKKESKLFNDTIFQSQGMVLVTGPTGSGKSITLYTGLHCLNDTERNIMSVEDPVEINIDGINQVHVNNRAGLNFETALRAFLRQDPDVIMVGEIRDLETAEVAIKAAQTGHMVFSTLHTNTAPETLTRLANMGVSHFNIASTVSLIVAQRLVRVLCNECKVPEKVTEKTLLELGFSKKEIPSIKVFSPEGCIKCKDGYSGRQGLFSMLWVSDTISRIILDGGNAMQITDQAQKEGMITLKEAGLIAIKKGITSITEVNRVIV